MLMKPIKFILGLSVFFILFIGALAGYFSFDENSDSPFISRSESSTKDRRKLEPSMISQQTQNVENEPSALFNDPAIKEAWGLKKSDAARAWSLSKGSKDIVVAVIDTGIDVNHEDLKKNLWNNPGETGKDALGRDKSTNGIDDDNNGFIDDVHGWNFVSNNNDLTDNHGHGTHIAGIIGAEAGNGKGISGIAPEVSIMSLKYFDPKVSGTDNLRNTIKAILYAVKNGAHIINYSGGGVDFSKEEKEAIQIAEKKGILFIAAAGNERTNSDKNHYYPADYGLSNIISVTAIDPSTEVLSSSNYGTTTVDIAAPGQNILSTLPGNSYGLMTGTSQATAFVSGAAAIVMAHKHSFNVADIKKYILSTGDAQASLLSKTRTSRKLNLYKALTILDQGVSANGVVGVNDGDLSNTFISDPNLRKSKSNAEEVTSFGKNLIEKLNPKVKTIDRTGSKNDL